MSRKLRFARFGEFPSTRLRLAAWWFTFAGVIQIVAVAGAVVAAFVGFGTMDGWRIVGLLVSLAFAFVNLAVGRALLRRSRRAGIVALVLFALPALAVAVGGGASTASVVIGLVGIAIVLSVWSELRDEPLPA